MPKTYFPASWPRHRSAAWDVFVTWQVLVCIVCVFAAQFATSVSIMVTVTKLRVSYLTGIVINTYASFGRFGENSKNYVGIEVHKQYRLLDTIFNNCIFHFGPPGKYLYLSLKNRLSVGRRSRPRIVGFLYFFIDICSWSSKMKNLDTNIVSTGLYCLWTAIPTSILEVFRIGQNLHRY